MRPMRKSSEVSQKETEVRHPMRWYSRPKFRISRFENISLKDTDGKENFKRMQFLLVDKGRLFFTKLSFEVFEVFLTQRRSWPILKHNQAATFLKNFQVNFVHCTILKKITFLKADYVFCKY